MFTNIFWKISISTGMDSIQKYMEFCQSCIKNITAHNVYDMRKQRTRIMCNLQCL